MITESADSFVEVEIAGQTYKATRLTVADFGELRYLATKRKTERLTRLYKELPHALMGGEEVYRELLFRIQDTEHSILDDLALLGTKEGAYDAAWLSLRKHHPEITRFTVEKKIPEADVISLAMQMSGMGGLIENAPNKPDVGNVLRDDEGKLRRESDAVSTATREPDPSGT